MEHFSEIRCSELFERMVCDRWKNGGAEKFEDRLRQITFNKMNHRSEPIPEDVIKELDKMQRGWK